MSEPLIHPTAIVLGDVQLGKGCIIGPFVVIGELARQPQNLPEGVIIGRDAFIRSHTVIYNGNRIGDGFQTGHGVLIREGNLIGNHVSIGSHSVIEHHVQIGDRVRVHSNAFIPEFCVLEDECWIGPSVVLTNARYPQSPRAKQELVGVHICRRARIGAGAIILPGITVGEEALVGAGAVVTHDVAPGGVVVGNPARQIRTVDQISAYSRSQ